MGALKPHPVLNPLLSSASIGATCSPLPMGQAMVEIIEPDCTGCDLCITHCPFEALLPLSECAPHRKKRAVVVLNATCVGCLSCIGSCPTGALREVVLPPDSTASPLLTERDDDPDVVYVARWSSDGVAWA